MGILFLFLVISVVVPCVLADIVVPLVVAGFAERKKGTRVVKKELVEK